MRRSYLAAAYKGTTSPHCPYLPVRRGECGHQPSGFGAGVQLLADPVVQHLPLPVEPDGPLLLRLRDAGRGKAPEADADGLSDQRAAPDVADGPQSVETGVSAKDDVGPGRLVD